MNLKTLIIKNLKKQKLLFFQFTFCFILSSIALSIEPYVASRIIGCFNIENKDQLVDAVIFWLIVFIIAKSIQAINQYFVTLTKIAFTDTLKANIVIDLFKTAHAHETRYFDDEMTGRISTAITTSANTLSSIIANTLFLLFRPVINFIFAFCIIAYCCPKLALTITFLCLPSYYVSKFFSKKIHAIWKQRGTAEREYFGFLSDGITNYKLVRYVGSFFTEKLNAYKIFKKYLRQTYTCENNRAYATFSLNICKTIFTISCYIIIIYFTVADSLSLADAVFAFSTIEIFSASIGSLCDFSLHFAQNLGTLTSNIELIYKPIKTKDKESAHKLQTTENNITIKDLNFYYIAEKPVFTNFNLNILANQKIGLVGYSGSGKSTLINLIMRTYTPQSGQILIGTENITDVTEFSLHKNISYVPQDVTLFNRSLKENLRIAKPDATDSKIYEACKLAYIHDTITNLQNGYDSVVGERGILLSGGERQRIAIARAILQNAPILILDEATSALDSEAEIFIQKALDNLMQNKTVIAIAHRLSTLRSMDRIIVLEKGQIIEDDKPSSLLKKKKGTFKELFQLQTNGYINIAKEENNQ